MPNTAVIARSEATKQSTHKHCARWWIASPSARNDDINTIE
jgi:hypothetical protein